MSPPHVRPNRTLDSVAGGIAAMLDLPPLDRPREFPPDRVRVRRAQSLPSDLIPYKDAFFVHFATQSEQHALKQPFPRYVEHLEDGGVGRFANSDRAAFLDPNSRVYEFRVCRAACSSSSSVVTRPFNRISFAGNHFNSAAIPIS